jgi:hypothetical protein
MPNSHASHDAYPIIVVFTSSNIDDLLKCECKFSTNLTTELMGLVLLLAKRLNALVLAERRASAAPPVFKLRSNPDMGTAEVVRCAVRGSAQSTFTHSLALPTCSFLTMSDLCPVYAPFFGAMVSSYSELLHLKS